MNGQPDGASSNYDQQLQQLKAETSSSTATAAGLNTSSTQDHPTAEEDLRPWGEQGLNDKITQKIQVAIQNGKLSATDVDARVCEQLRSLPDDAAAVDSLFAEFISAEMTGVVNKGAFLCNLIKQWKSRNPQFSGTGAGFGDGAQADAHKPGPDEAKLKAILDRTGYKLEITAGQRKYGGPPPDGPEKPAANSEIFIGKVPRECFEDEIIPLAEEAGKIWDLRLMVDPATGYGKGYCFVTYCRHEDSVKACDRLNGYTIRPGKILKVNGSVANVRLFIGNIPKTKSKEEIKEELSKYVEGVTDVIVYTPADEADKKKNRGFAFVDFDSHKNASAAKRKLSTTRTRVFNRDVALDWADPDEEPDDETMSKVKVLYVRNLTSDVTEQDVKDLFLPYGNIERVRKVRDYAFVHFDTRDDALNAMRALNNKVLGRNPMEISLAKPMSEKRKQAQLKREQRKQFDPPFYARQNFDGPQGGGYQGNFQGQGRGGFQGGYQGGPSGGGSDFGGYQGGDARGGGSWRGNRGGPMGGRGGGPGGFSRGGGPGNFGGNRGGFNNNAGGFNGPQRGGFQGNQGGGFNNNRGGYQGGPPMNQGGGGFNSNPNMGGGPQQMGGGGGGFQNGPQQQGGYGFGNQGYMPPQNNMMNQGGFRPQQQGGPMGGNPNQMGGGGGGMNQQPNNNYAGGMKRGPPQMGGGGDAKRPRQDGGGSWGSMGGDGGDGSSQGPPQNNNGGGQGQWYQDQGYSSQQQQSSYSWN